MILSPLITSPYLSRVLGAKNIGIYASANATATYFVLFSLLGVSDYGNRSIAQIRENESLRSDRFWQIFYLQIILTFCMLVLYIIFCYLFRRNSHVYWILTIYVASSFIETNWFAFGMEKFKWTSIRSITVRILIVIAILCFVKNENDLWKYALIMTLGNFFSALILIPLIAKYTDFKRPNIKKILSHIKPNLILFFPVIATSIYQQMDKIMLGIKAVKSEVGYYQNAENIVTLPMFVTTAIVTVMLPYSSNLLANGLYHKNNNLLRLLLKVTSIINIGMAFGIAGISKTFIPWFLGEGYERTAKLIVILAPMIFFAGFSNILRYQYLIPAMLEKIYLTSIILGAMINLLLNIILIPKFHSDGAAIATTIAYFTVCFLQIFFTRHNINYKEIIYDVLPYVCFGTIMYFSINSIRLIFNYLPSYILTLIEIVFGALIYGILLGIWIKIKPDKEIIFLIQKKGDFI